MEEVRRPVLGARPDPEQRLAEGRSLRSQHRELQACVERAGAALDALSGRPAPADTAQTHRLLQKLCARLLEHLETEERSRILERAARAAPRFLEQAEFLLGQHGELRAMVDALAVEETRADGGDWAQVRARFVTLRDALRDHEAAENDLIHRAYTEDVGGSG